MMVSEKLEGYHETFQILTADQQSNSFLTWTFCLSSCDAVGDDVFWIAIRGCFADGINGAEFPFLSVHWT